MTNAHVNKVVYGSSTLIDLTADTVTPATLMQGYTAHDASGAAIVGTASGGGTGGNVWQDAQGYVHLDDEGGGSSVDVEPLSVTANGTYTAPSGTAYSPVTVAVPSSGESWSWLGKNPVLVHTFEKERTSFRDLGLGDWTWGTSQTTLRSAQAYDSIVVPDYNLYDYCTITRCYVHYDYGQWTPVAAVTSYAYVGGNLSYITYNTPASLISGVPAYRGVTSIAPTQAYRLLYQSSSGETSTSTIYQGVYSYSMKNPTYSANSTTYELTITASRPLVYARGTESYFSETAFANVDMDASYYEVETEVWRTDRYSNTTTFTVEESRNILVNGL